MGQAAGAITPDLAFIRTAMGQRLAPIAFSTSCSEVFLSQYNPAMPHIKIRRIVT